MTSLTEYCATRVQELIFFFHLTFQGLPNFIKSPEDQTGISGGVASFVCQAAGEPKPRITWMKKGKKVSSQRFEVTNCLSLPLLTMSLSRHDAFLSIIRHLRNTLNFLLAILC